MRNSLIRDRIVLEIRSEETNEKLLRIRNLTFNKCVDVCGREKVTAMRMKSFCEPVDSVNQVKSKKTKPKKKLVPDMGQKHDPMHSKETQKNTGNLSRSYVTRSIKGSVNQL